MQKNLLGSLALVVALMSGCSQKAPEIDTTIVNEGLNTDNIPQSTGTGLDGNIDRMTGMDSDSVSYASEDERIAAIENELQPIYFGTDRYDISVTESEKVDMDANVLNGPLSSDLGVSIEGNCDEWGTDEYNYALGLKRAKALKDSLMASGVDSGRMSIISFGESKPQCDEHNAECWQQNRRSDIKIMLP